MKTKNKTLTKTLRMLFLTVFFLLAKTGLSSETFRDESCIADSSCNTDPIVASLKDRLYSYNELYWPPPARSEEKKVSYLSYNELLKLQEEKKITPVQANKLIDHAYHLKDPLIFRKAKEKIAPESYSLNFLWINAQALKETGHLTGRHNERLRINVIRPIIDWHTKQPQANINFWYDGDMIKDEDLAIKNTKAILSDYELVNLNKIKFRNIRNIDKVRENANLFKEEVAIFLRVDLAKILIAEHVLKNDNITYSVTIDSDLFAITNEQLFDEESLRMLKSLGYQFSTVGFSAAENDFLMLHNNKLTLDVYRKHLIDPSIKEANQYIKKEEFSRLPGVVYRQIGCSHPLFINLEQDTSFTSSMLKKYREAVDENWGNENIQDRLSTKALIRPPSQINFSRISPKLIKAIEALRPYLFGRYLNLTEIGLFPETYDRPCSTDRIAFLEDQLKSNNFDDEFTPASKRLSSEREKCEPS